MKATRKLLAMLLSVCVILAFMPMTAFADSIELDASKVTIEDMAFTGETLTPVVKYDGKTLTPGSDYAIAITEGKIVKNADTYTANITPVEGSNYTVSGTIEKTFKVTQLNPATVTATIAPKKVGTTVTYDSSNITFKNGTGTLTLLKDTDYTVTPASGTVTVGSTNNVKIKYQGNNFSEEKEVNVAYSGKYDIEDYTFTPKDNSLREITYSKGTKNTTAFTVAKKSPDSDIPSVPTYKTEYSENEKVTGSNIIATITGSGDFMGTLTVDTNMKVVPKSLTAAGISCTVETSTGNMTAPEVTVKDGSIVLEKGRDYSTQVNEANKVTVTGQGNYKDSFEKTFTVGTQITEATLSKSLFTYNGLNQTPSITVKAGTETVPTTGYRTEWPSDTKNAGTKAVRIVGVGKYAGQIEMTYIISQKLSTDLSVTIPSDSYQYNGRAIEPVVTVKDGYTTLTKNTDYTVSYANNVSASYSPATVTVTLKGNYSGSKTVNFYIGKNTISPLTITLDKTSYDYTGSEIRPTVTVKNGTATVSSNNYVVTYKNNKAIGTGTVVITGKNDYYGTVEKTFPIVGKSIGKCTITLPSNGKYTADGTEKKPVPTVKYESKLLLPNTDYTVSYANNKQAGQASVTITGKGAYEGTQTVYFTITGLPQAINDVDSTYTKYTTSKPFKLSPTKNGDGTGFSFVSSNPSVAAVAADGTVTILAPGKAKITVSTVGDIKYTPVSKTLTVTVKPIKGVAKVTSMKGKKIKVTVTKQKGVTGYQIRYTNTTKYKYVTVSHKNNSYKTQYRVISNLKAGKKYKVAVRAYVLVDGKKIYGNWGNARTVTVK